jgi:hypothetical protein
MGVVNLLSRVNEINYIHRNPSDEPKGAIQVGPHSAIPTLARGCPTREYGTETALIPEGAGRGYFAGDADCCGPR